VPASLTNGRNHEVAGGGAVDCASEYLATLFDRYHRAPQRNAANKTLRTVDWVDQPPTPADFATRAEFLTHDGIARKTLLDPIPDSDFRFAIRAGNLRTVRLPFDRQPGPEVRECGGPADASGLVHGVQD
jgi:hypothetical protein